MGRRSLLSSCYLESVELYVNAWTHQSRGINVIFGGLSRVREGIEESPEHQVQRTTVRPAADGRTFRFIDFNGHKLITKKTLQLV